MTSTKSKLMSQSTSEFKKIYLDAISSDQAINDLESATLERILDTAANYYANDDAVNEFINAISNNAELGVMATVSHHLIDCFIKASKTHFRRSVIERAVHACQFADDPDSDSES